MSEQGEHIKDRLVMGKLSAEDREEASALIESQEELISSLRAQLAHTIELANQQLDRALLAERQLASEELSKKGRDLHAARRGKQRRHRSARS